MRKILAVFLAYVFLNPAYADVAGAPALIYDSSGNFLNSTSNALNVDVINFPSTFGVTQSTSPWVVSGTVTANQGGAPWSVSQSGTWNVGLNAGSNTIGSVTQAGGPWTINLTQIGGSTYSLGQNTMANSAPVVIASDQSAVPVTVGNATIATYVANVIGLVPAASATDVFTITGSGTKVVRIYKVRVLGSQTHASVVQVNLIKRSTLDTGGTSSPITPTSMDSSDGAATAVVTSYTANPAALGTSVGNVGAFPTLVPNSVAQLFEALYDDFGMRKPVTLNNANENLAVNLSSTTIAGGSLTIEVTWTEQ